MKKAMKLMAALLCVALVGMSVSCGKEKENDGVVTIMGTWNYVSYDTNGSNCAASGVWEFRTNGTVSLGMGGTTNEGTFYVDGSRLVWDFGYGEQELEIVTLTATDLRLWYPARSMYYNLKR